MSKHFNRILQRHQQAGTGMIIRKNLRNGGNLVVHQGLASSLLSVLSGRMDQFHALDVSHAVKTSLGYLGDAAREIEFLFVLFEDDTQGRIEKVLFIANSRSAGRGKREAESYFLLASLSKARLGGKEAYYGWYFHPPGPFNKLRLSMKHAAERSKSNTLQEKLNAKARENVLRQHLTAE